MAVKVQIGLDAKDVKDALRRRHPAYEPGFMGVGRWTCIEEWQNIDLLALDAWQSADVIGYEVKVSRGDMRTELLDPSKRAAAVAMCTRFYFAVPAGLLKPEERAYEEPEWLPQDFVRTACNNPDCTAGGQRRGFSRHYPKPRGSTLKGTEREGVSIRLGYETDRGAELHQKSDGSTYTSTYSRSYEITACCVTCKGYGTMAKSRVELEAPTLWVPKDVGLVAVGPRGCSVLKEAPRRKITEPILPWPFVDAPVPEEGRGSRRDPENHSRVQRQAINNLVRWVSARPDPRHAGPYSDKIDA